MRNRPIFSEIKIPFIVFYAFSSFFKPSFHIFNINASLRAAHYFSILFWGNHIKAKSCFWIFWIFWFIKCHYFERIVCNDDWCVEMIQKFVFFNCSKILSPLNIHIFFFIKYLKCFSICYSWKFRICNMLQLFDISP